MKENILKRTYRSMLVGFVVSLLIVQAFEITFPLITKYVTWSRHFFPRIIAAWTPGVYRAYTAWHHSVALDDLLEIVGPIVLGVILCIFVGFLIEKAIAIPFQRAFNSLSRSIPILRPLASVVEQGIKRLGINQEGDPISPPEMCVWMDGTLPKPCFFFGFTEPFDLVESPNSRLASIRVPSSPNWIAGEPKLVNATDVVRVPEVLVNGETLPANIDLVAYCVSGGSIPTRTLEILSIVARKHYDRRIHNLPDPGNFNLTFQGETLQIEVKRENDKLPLILTQDSLNLGLIRQRL